jgi:SAM-dependent methyltransferase
MNLLIESIKSVDEKKGSFHIPFIDGKKIEYKYTSNIIKWLKNYKPDFYFSSIDEYSKNYSQFKINPDIYSLINYFYVFIINDINHLLNFSLLPNKPFERILELGSGAGFFSIFLYKLYGGQILLDLVEIDETNEEDNSNFYNFRKEKKQYNGITYSKIGVKQNGQIKKMKKTKTLEILKEFTKINGVKCNIFSPDELKKKPAKDIYNFVYSFRSYCFLYDFDEYGEFLKNSMKKNAYILCDVAEDTGQDKKFTKAFKVIKKLDSNKSYFYRTLGQKK